MLGSSPLARGLHILISVHNPVCRFIPVGAGSALLKRRFSLAKWVHPRWRGVCEICRLDLFEDCGSPPLARGLQKVTDTVRAAWGVHPRWRGVCAKAL